MKIMDKLSTYAALIGVIGAIGGGFYAWGEFNNRLSVLEDEPPVNLSPLKQKDKELTKQFDDVLQSEWFMPDEYKNLDIYRYLEEQCGTPDEVKRVDEEFIEYEKRGLLDLLRFLVYLVKIMRENNIVWGVGRGSSVASYILYLIGIHKINSIQYQLDWHEFMR